FAVLFAPSMAPLPLSARPRDWFFVVVFAAFALTSFLVDTLPALGWSTFMHDALVASYADCDPMFMRPPPFLLVAATVSGFVWWRRRGRVSLGAGSLAGSCGVWCAAEP